MKSPIEVVNKPRKTRNSSAPKKKRTSSSKTKSKRKKTVAHHVPKWIIVLLTILVISSFTSLFYYFFIRPYAYRWKECPGEKEYGVCMPSNYDIHGIDISHYQGKIDWELLTQSQSKQFPIHFVFIKASEGRDLGDDTFESNFTQAKKYGYIRGAYHFFNPETEAEKQADFFIQTVQLEAGDLPPVLDVEKIGKRKKAELVKAVKIWLNKIEAHYGVKPILYTSYKFKNKYLDDSTFNAYPYWIAHYYVDSVEYKGKWHFWQHTDVGSIRGIKEEVDLNIFNGTLEELKEITISEKQTRRACNI